MVMSISRASRVYFCHHNNCKVIIYIYIYIPVSKTRPTITQFGTLAFGILYICWIKIYLYKVFGAGKRDKCSEYPRVIMRQPWEIFATLTLLNLPTLLYHSADNLWHITHWQPLAYHSLAAHILTSDLTTQPL